MSRRRRNSLLKRRKKDGSRSFIIPPFVVVVVVAGETRVPFAVSCLPRRFKSAKEGEKKPSSLEKKGCDERNARFSINLAKKDDDNKDDKNNNNNNEDNNKNVFSLSPKKRRVSLRVMRDIHINEEYDE